MGCNCGKGAGSTIAARAREAARQRSGLVVGYDIESAIELGEATSDAPIRVRVIRATRDGLSVGSAVWVKGADVPGLLDAGDLVDITQRNQSRRAWTVSGFTYFNEQEANQVAAALGTKPIEVA